MQILDNGFVKGLLLTLSGSSITLGGGYIIKANTDNAVQDSQIAEFAKVVPELHAMNDNLTDLKTQVAVLNQELKDEKRDHK